MALPLRFLALVVVGPLACAIPKDVGDTPNSRDDTATAEERICFEAAAEVSAEIGTVITVTWTTDQPGTSRVEFADGYVTPGGDALTTEHRVVVAGARAREPWSWRAVSEIDGERCVSVAQEVPAATPLREMPAWTVTGESGAGWSLIVANGDHTFITLFDATGAPCWWRAVEDGYVTTQVRLSRDGQAILYNRFDAELAEDVGEIVRVSLDGTDVRTVRTPMAHHDFVELPDGRYAYLAVDIRDHEGERVAGDAVVVVDPDTGATETVWSTWDDLPVDITEASGEFYAGAVDWTHGNSLAYDPATESYYVSTKNTSQVHKVQDGRRVWSIGRDGDFTLTSGERFDHQHAAVLTDDGLLVFSNGDKYTSEFSQAMRFTLDEEARTWAETWRETFDELHYVYLLGNVEQVSDGTLFATLGSAGIVQRLTESGEVLSELSVQAGYFVGYGHPVDALGGAVSK